MSDNLASAVLLGATLYLMAFWFVRNAPGTRKPRNWFSAEYFQDALDAYHEISQEYAEQVGREQAAVLEAQWARARQLTSKSN